MKFQAITCGETLPVKNPHAISVSMPTLQDVIDYEEQTPEIAQCIKSAYPRFVRHPYIMQLSAYLLEKYELGKDFELVVLSSRRAAEDVSACLQLTYTCHFDEPFGVVAVRQNTSDLKDVMKYIQLTGNILSSRAAQDYLFEVGVLKTRFAEDVIVDQAEEKVRMALAKAYRQPLENVAIAPSGMNAVYAAVTGLRRIQEKQGRDIFVQLGWLYSDSMSVVDKYSTQAAKFLDVTKLDELEIFLQESGSRVSGILTEVPSNPLLKCVDLPRLRSLCAVHHIPLLIDTTIATPYLFDFSPYADIMIESMSKFASGNADVLMGAVIINANFATDENRASIFLDVEPVYRGDAQRMAFAIQPYEQRVRKVSANTKALIGTLETRPYIKQVFSHHFDGAYVGLISVTFHGDYETIYNTLNLPKGPSLGTEFTLAMPYAYLAHYDLIQSEEGRALLAQIDLPTELLRVSVGIEPIEDIIAEFDRIGETVING